MAWASERKDVLAGLFWMLTLLAYAAYVNRPGRIRYLGIAAAVGTASRALDPSLGNVPPELRAGIEERLREYRSGRPFRSP